MSIINWDNVLTRYTTIKDYDSTSAQQVENIAYAEGELNRRLSSCYDVPFSSNNITAKDLTIDIAFANTIKYKDTEKYTAIMEQIDKITKDLCGGQTSMIDDTGAVILPTGTSGSGKAYSSTQNYSPTFDMDDQINQHVSEDMLEGIEDGKN